MTDTPAPDGHMTGGELQTVREYLGLTGDRLAAMLDVAPRTVRAWEAGKYPVPDGVRVAVEDLEAQTAAAVGAVVDALSDMASPAVVVYRTDEDLAAARPDAAHLGARWWRHVVARAVAEVPGVVVGTETEVRGVLRRRRASLSLTPRGT